jgi:phosphoenolpyruvate synthase/pyruvate phosphate dikinase
MTPLVLSLSTIRPEDRTRLDGKGFALAVMARGGFQVPTAPCITPEAYLEFVTATGIRETILLELGRKSFEDRGKP